MKEEQAQTLECVAFLTSVRAQLSSRRNTTFYISRSHKWSSCEGRPHPIMVTSPHVTLKRVLSSKPWGLLWYYQAEFQKLWRMEILCLSSHTMSNYFSGNQVSLNVQSECFKLLTDRPFVVSFSLSFPCGLKVFGPLFIFVLGLECTCTSGSNTVLCGLCVTFVLIELLWNQWDRKECDVQEVRRLLFLKHGLCPYEHNAQSPTGLLFPTETDNDIWVQLLLPLKE